VFVGAGVGVDGTGVAVGVGVGGTGVSVGNGVAVGVGVGEGNVGVGVLVVVSVGVGVSGGDVSVGVPVAVSVGVTVGTAVAVAVAVTVGEAVGVQVGVMVLVAVGTEVGVWVGVGRWSHGLMMTITTRTIAQVRKHNPPRAAVPQASQAHFERSQPPQPAGAFNRAACKSRCSPAANISGVGVGSGTPLRSLLRCSKSSRRGAACCG
jgi:hypothetical protein